MTSLSRARSTEHIPIYQDFREGPVDAWIDACAPIFGIAPLRREDASKTYRSQSWFIDPIMISVSDYFEMATERGERHITESGAQLHVYRYARGRASMQTDGLPVECETGSITLLDYSRPFAAIHSNNVCQSFFIPHQAIGYRPSDAPHALNYDPQSQMGQLIGGEMDVLLAQLRNGANGIDPADIQRFLGCIEVAMCPRTASMSATTQLRASLKRAIQVFVEQRLSLPDLNTRMILQNFGVSRASLYRLFDAQDGVRNYINRRRLVRAVTELARTPRTRGQIHRVSERWGFSSDASFNRMVKRVYGVTPGALFQMPVQIADTFTPSSNVQALMLANARTRDLALV